jgi:hypothetical protein
MKRRNYVDKRMMAYFLKEKHYCVSLLLSLCRILVYELGYIWTCVVLGVNRLGVVFESDSSSLDLKGTPHRYNL